MIVKSVHTECYWIVLQTFRGCRTTKREGEQFDAWNMWSERSPSASTLLLGTCEDSVLRSAIFSIFLLFSRNIQWLYIVCTVCNGIISNEFTTAVPSGDQWVHCSQCSNTPCSGACFRRPMGCSKYFHMLEYVFKRVFINDILEMAPRKKYRRRFRYEQDVADHMYPISNFPHLLLTSCNFWKFLKTAQSHPVYSPCRSIYIYIYIRACWRTPMGLFLRYLE